MPDEPLLRQKARAAVQNGKLPGRRPDGTYGGAGNGAQCSVCGLPITSAQTELELEFARSGDRSGRDLFHLHARCFAAWEFERVKVVVA